MLKLTVALVVVALVSGCAGNFCQPDKIVDCICDDGKLGKKMCSADGEDYDGCVCGSAQPDAGMSEPEPDPNPYPPVALLGIYEGATNYLERQDYLLHVAIEADHRFTGNMSTVPTSDPSKRGTFQGKDKDGRLQGTISFPGKLTQYFIMQFIVDADLSTPSVPVYKVFFQYCNSYYASCGTEHSFDFEQVRK